MFDVKPTVNELLSSIPGVTVSDAYPKDFNKLPHISFYELSNTDPHQLSKEVQTEIVLQIDIWHNRSTGTLASEVNEKMKSIGFRREFAGDIPDPSGIKHKTMRYRGIVDNRNHLVYYQ